MKLWRLTRFPDLTGQGGLHAPARWHNQGRPILYTATQPPGSLLEILVHLDVEIEEIPTNYVLLGLEVPDAIEAVTPSLPKKWRESPRLSRAVGDSWLNSTKSLLLRVPSAIIDQTDNILVNPAHPDMKQVAIAYQKPFVFDPRLA